MASEIGRLDQVITNIVDVFLEYASEDETQAKKAKLNQEELKKVLEKEIKTPELKEKINPDDIEDIMSTLDKNHDGEVNFREFCRCLSDLAKCYYHKKTGRGKKGKAKEGEQPED